MKILFLLTQSLESPGGGGRFMPIAQALVQKGFRVTIIALHHDYKQLHERRFTQDGVEVYYVGQMHVRKVGNEKIYFSPLKLIWITAVSTIKMTYATLKTPVDLIHVCKAQPMNGISAWITHKIRRTPVFLDSDDYEAVNNRFGGRWQQRLVSWFEDWYATFVDGITVNTHFIANYYRNLGYPKEQIRYVPNGVDKKRFSILDKLDIETHLITLRQSLAIETNQQVVVYVGSMSLTSHAIDLLIESFEVVQQENSQAILLLVGAGEDLNELKQLARNLDIEKSVLFIGRVSVEDVPYYYRLGYLSVDPMRNSIPAQSSLSLKLVESMAAGVPCVTADIGDRKQIAGEAGLAVIPDDKHALAQGILNILSDSDMALKMHHAALQKRHDLWWEQRAEVFVDFYKNH